MAEKIGRVPVREQDPKVRAHNFEEVCYRSAVLKEPINNYVRMPRYPFDINMFMMPMAYEDDQCAYCTFSQVLLPREDDNLISMNRSHNKV